jgi:hypothetical protein
MPLDAELAGFIANSRVRYQARIRTAEGDFADRGLNPLAGVHRVTNDMGQITYAFFDKDFFSDLAATEPSGIGPP